jgi:hypothetical protein
LAEPFARAASKGSGRGDVKGFCAAFKIGDNLFAQPLFQFFDTTDSGGISLAQFVHGLALVAQPVRRGGWGIPHRSTLHPT